MPRPYYSTATVLTGCLALLANIPRAGAAPYASGVTFTSPTAVSFTLNEPADFLSVSINGGPATLLDGTTKGTKTFTLPSASATFSITAAKTDSVGYTIPTGATIANPTSNGLGQPTAASGFRLISDDTNVLNRFNSPRGVSVATNPNSGQFGTAYVSNSLAGSLTTGVTRTLGDGIYALKADQSDAFGYGDTAQAAGLGAVTSSASSPFRIMAARDGNVYVADFSDTNGSVFRINGNLTAGTLVLTGTNSPTAPNPLPAGQNHGSTTAVYVSGSSAGDLTVYTLDEDLTSAQFGGASTTDRNSLWRYDIGSSALPFSGTPTKLASVLVPAATSDLDRGANGNFYLAQNRAAGNEAGLFVLAADGTTLLFDSLSATRTLLGDPAATDLFRNILAIAVSLDQKYLAAVLNNSDVAILPLDSNGVPNLANRLLVDTGTDINSGRDIAFDAVGNIHYVSSGQALYRVLSPGGFNSATTSWNGTSFNFANVPEPMSALLVSIGALLLSTSRRRKSA